MGFFDDVKYPIYKGGFEIVFKRADDHFAIHKDTADPRAKIVIEEFIIRPPIITYDELSKVQLVNQLGKYRFNFRKWQCVMNRVPNGKTATFDITNIYQNKVRYPLFGIVALEVGKDNNYDQHKNCSTFDHCNVKNIYFEVNGRRYPEESLDLDWDKGKIGIAYDMLTHYSNVFGQNQRVEYPTLDQFKKTSPLFCVDLSKQPENTSEMINNIIVRVDFNKNASVDAICFVCLISHSEFVYDVLNNTVRVTNN